MTTVSVPSTMKFDAYEDPWYFRIMHINACLSICSTSMAIYFILFKSPRSIGTYKWFLLNISVCSLLFDLTLTTLWQPQFLLPAMAVCTRGLMKPLGWKLGALGGFYLWMFLYGTAMMSINWAFVYRWAILTRRDHLFRRKSAIMIMGFLQMFYMTPTAVFCGISIWDREALVREVKRKYVNIGPFIDNQPCTFASYEASAFAVLFMFSFAVQNFLSIPIASTFLFLSYQVLNNSKHLMSKKTIKQHRQLLGALFFQLIIPFATLFVPYTLNATLVLLAVEDLEEVYKIGFLLSTIHSFLNTTMMIWKIAAYRAAFLNLIGYVQSMLVPKRFNIKVISPTYYTTTTAALSKTHDVTLSRHM